MSLTYDKRIQAMADDGSYDEGTSTWKQGQTVRMGHSTEVTGDINAYFRFTDVGIPQGATIESAYFKMKSTNTVGNALTLRVKAIDEDNTAVFSESTGGTNPNSRSQTDAYVDWSIASWPIDTVFTSPDIKTVIQEVVDRANWKGGNALAVVLRNNGSTNYSYCLAYEGSLENAPELIVTFSGSTQTFASRVSAGASIIKTGTAYGLKVSKPTYNVLTETAPENFIFTSSYGTLKYALSGTLDMSVYPFDGLVTHQTITHNFNFFPIVELYVDVYTSTPTGNYEYCPTGGDIGANYWTLQFRVTDTVVHVYSFVSADIGAVYFDVKYFIYKNALVFPNTVTW